MAENAGTLITVRLSFRSSNCFPSAVFDNSEISINDIILWLGINTPEETLDANRVLST